MVKVGDLKLIACYQPTTDHPAEDIEEYRWELEEQLRLANAKEWLIIGGDHNSTVGKREHENYERGTCGVFGLGKTNEAGKELLRWCQLHGLSWCDSFFQIERRGTWQNQRNGQWHELDGFIVRRSQRRRLVESVIVIKEDNFSDHRPKAMLINIEKPKFTPSHKIAKINA